MTMISMTRLFYAWSHFEHFFY